MYDLEVADAHEFVAAGVIVHNCQLVHHLKPAVARQRIESDERLYRNARGRARRQRRPGGPNNPYARAKKRPVQKRPY